MDRTLSGATTPVQSRPGSDSNKGVLCILQSSNITEISPLDCLMLNPGHSLTEMQLEYSTATANWANIYKDSIDIELVVLGDKHFLADAIIRPNLIWRSWFDYHIYKKITVTKHHSLCIYANQDIDVLSSIEQSLFINIANYMINILAFESTGFRSQLREDTV